MKRSLIILISSAIAFILGACNKHSWDEGTDANPPTKKVFEVHGHGDHGKDDGDHKGHDGDKEHKKEEPAK